MPLKSIRDIKLSYPYPEVVFEGFEDGIEEETWTRIKMQIGSLSAPGEMVFFDHFCRIDGDVGAYIRSQSPTKSASQSRGFDHLTGNRASHEDILFTVEKVILRPNQRGRGIEACYKLNGFDTVVNANAFPRYRDNEVVQLGLLIRDDAGFTFHCFKSQTDLSGPMPDGRAGKAVIDIARADRIALLNTFDHLARALGDSQRHLESNLARWSRELNSVRTLLEINTTDGTDVPAIFDYFIVRVVDDVYVIRGLRDTSAINSQIEIAIANLKSLQDYKLGYTPDRCRTIVNKVESELSSIDVSSLTQEQMAHKLKTLKDFLTTTLEHHNSLPLSEYWPPAKIEDWE